MTTTTPDTVQIVFVVPDDTVEYVGVQLLSGELKRAGFKQITAFSFTSRNLERQIRRFLVSQAIPMALMGIPGIYIHSLLGSRNDYDGVEASGRARSINREQLHIGRLQAELAFAERRLGEARRFATEAQTLALAYGDIYEALTCNGLDYTPTPPYTDAVRTGILNECVAEYDTEGQLLDMSGN